MLLTAVFACFLSSGALVENATRQPFGWRRDVSLSIAKKIDAVSGALWLDEPRRLLIKHLRGEPSDRPAAEPSSAAPAAASTQSPAGVSASAGDGSVNTRASAGARAGVTSGVTQPVPAAAPITTPGPTVPTAVPVRIPTAAAPLDVMIVGDSMARDFGDALVRQLGDHAEFSTARGVDARIGTGMARPDIFDWNAHVRNVVRDRAPETVVVLFGANDGQNLQVGGDVLDFGSPEWRAEYGRRTADLMDAVGRNRRLFWVGMPICRKPAFSARMRTVDEVVQEQAASRPWVHYVETWSLFTNDQGRYADHLVNQKGKRVLVRQPDGIHLTISGANRMAAPVLSKMRDVYGVTDPAPTPTTTVVTPDLPPLVVVSNDLGSNVASGTTPSSIPPLVFVEGDPSQT